MGRFRKPSDHDEECQEDIRYLNKDIPLSKSTLSSKDEQSFAPSEAKAINRKAVIETQEVHSSSGHDEDMDHDEDEIVPIYADDKPSRGVKDALILRRGRGGFYWILARPSWVRLLSDWSVRITIVIALIIGVQTTIRIQWESGFDAGYLDAEENIFGIPTQALEGVACQQLGTTDEDCADANKIRQAIQWSRYFLHRGDASSSVQLWEEARSFYRQSMDFGSGVGAQAAIYAARRVQFQSMACQYSRESLKRISRDYAMNPLGDVIEMKQKQRALRALGYYNGEVHNQHTAETRNAIRDFQADIWFDQNGVLSAEQTVLLICGGAQIANDISSQNVLGIMFAAGLGVLQNTDYALNWLEVASGRGDADAAWNLALMYGTGTVMSSVQICDAVQNEQRADSYLDLAIHRGHPAAKIAAKKYPDDTPVDRWRKLSGDLDQPEALLRVGRGCNPNG